MPFEFSLKERETLKKNYEEALKDPQFLKLVKHLGLINEEAMKRTTKILDTLEE